MAQRRRMRIHEIPVDRVENRDSRVDIVATALADLRGVTRLLFRRWVPSLALISRHRPMLAS